MMTTRRSIQSPSRSSHKLIARIDLRQHTQFELRLIRTKDERPHGRKYDVGRGFQERVNQVSRRTLVIVNGDEVFTWRNIRDLELKKLIFNPHQLLAWNAVSLRIRRAEFELRPIHHLAGDFNSRPAHQVFHRNANDISRRAFCGTNAENPWRAGR